MAARSQVGRDPKAHVRLALWCESHGLRSERMKHLALAVLYDPSHALARGLLGMVAYQGKWGRPEVVGPQIQNDPAYRDAIREYLERRPRTADKADAQLKLAAWCEQKGLKAQALTHYEQVIRARSDARHGLEAPRFQEAGEPLGQGRSSRGREAGSRTAEASR